MTSPSHLDSPPDELMEQICPHCGLDSIVLLWRLRNIVKSYSETVLYNGWPWLNSGSREAFNIDRRRKRLEELHEITADVTPAEIPKSRTHTNEQVPAHVVLLRDPSQLMVGFYLDYCTYCTSTIHTTPDLSSLETASHSLLCSTCPSTTAEVTLSSSST